MPIYFRSYCSSSAGNCLALWTGDSCLLVDCGVRTLRACRTLLGQHQARYGLVSAIVVSHAHRDHLSHDAYRILQEEEISIHAHEAVVPQLRERHVSGGSASPIKVLPDEGLAVGDFRVTAIPLSHDPDVPTFGFVIQAGHGTQRRTVVVCTDFNQPSDVLPHLPGADFVFVEANHDAKLLNAHFNPRSLFHLDNRQTARLLLQAARGGRPPLTVVLGHLSEERNRERLAVAEVERAFAHGGLKMPFHVEPAPKCEASRVFRID